METIKKLSGKDQEIINALAMDAARKYLSEITCLHNVQLSKDVFERGATEIAEGTRNCIGNAEGMNVLHIEKGIQIQKQKRTSLPTCDFLDQMEVGDSFSIEGVKQKSISACISNYSRIAKKKFRGTEETPGRFRYWRIA